jgi:hypothetical protein
VSVNAPSADASDSSSPGKTATKSGRV